MSGEPAGPIALGLSGEASANATSALRSGKVTKPWWLAALAALVAVAPWSWLGRLAAPVAWLVGSVVGIRRRHVEHALIRAEISEANRVAKAMYRSLARSLLEFFWLAGRTQVDLDDLVVFSDSARCQLARVNGRKDSHDKGGAIIVTAHTGNWDLVGCASARRLVAGLSVVTQSLHVSWLDRAWRSVRASFGIEFVRGDDLYRNLSRRLRDGRNVAMVIDQAPEHTDSVVSLPFAGALARYDILPAVLATRTGRPIVLALGRRGEDGRHVVEVPLVLEAPSRPSRAWIVAAMRELNACLEAFVREHPDQWLWMHRRWKGRPSRSRGRSSDRCGSRVS